MQKAEMQTLGPHDWKKVKESKALQLTILDKIIEKCETTKGGY